MFGNFSRRDKQKIVKLVRERGRQPLSQRDTQRRKGLEPLRIFPVKLERDGGLDGDISNECTYTYTVRSIEDDSALASSVDPTTGLAATTTAHGGTCRHPGALGSIQEADFGSAFWNGDGYIVIIEFNERQHVAPCA